MRLRIPTELKSGPITVAEARAVGVTWTHLQTTSWTRLSRGQYAWKGLEGDVELDLRAVELRLPREYAFSGRTAAWILGLDMSPRPIEVTVARDIPIRARSGMRLRRASLPESDVIVRRAFRTTGPLRTVRDLGSHLDLVESVVAIDMALHAGLVDHSMLTRFVETHPGEKGIRRLRRALRFSDWQSESPMETRLRLELIAARLPCPCVQAELRDRSGNFIGRADLYYPDVRLAIEYDGENHRDRLVSDLRRQNALINAGYHLLRFTAADLRVPGSVAAQVRKARSRLKRSGR